MAEISRHACLPTVPRLAGYVTGAFTRKARQIMFAIHGNEMECNYMTLWPTALYALVISSY